MTFERDISLSNQLIAVLPDASRTTLLERCELVELKLNEVLIQAGQVFQHAYFPLSGFVSIVKPSDDGPNVQVAIVGAEGMFDTSVVLQVAVYSAIVQGVGQALRIRRDALELQLLDDPFLRKVLHCYVDVRQFDLAQQAACINYHTVGQRLARWLLTARDLSHSRKLFLTHEFLSVMMGVRRESVSRAASSMEKQGLIDCGHSCISLLDEGGLKRMSCNCYGNSLTTYAQMLGMKAMG